MANMTRSQRYNTTNLNNKRINKTGKNIKTLKKVHKKKFKIKYKTVIIFLVVLLIAIYALMSFFKLRITNIYISGNNTLNDQKIIDIAEISDYPNSFLNFSYKIKNKLEESPYIKSAKVYKEWFTILHIEIEENRPLFYNDSVNETVLLDGTILKEELSAPTLINLIPDTLYDKFILKMQNINEDVLNRVSEIKYDKNDVDNTRFLFTMNDGNYVYLSLNQFEKINNYFNIIKNVNNATGILYLDSGEYFEILEK